MTNSKKVARRLVLKGSDNQYAKRDALKAEQPVVAPFDQDLALAVEYPRSKTPDASLGLTRALPLTAQKPPIPKPVLTADDLSMVMVRISFQINLGEEISVNVTELAAKYAVPMEYIIKSARLRAIKLFKSTVRNGEPFPDTEIEDGGLTTPVTTRFTGTLAAKINAEFDPLGLGIAATRVKPVLAYLVQKQLRDICAAGT